MENSNKSLADLVKERQKTKEEKKKNQSSNQKRISSGRTLIQGLEDHIFNKKNIMKYFFRKTRNRAKKYEFYNFFFNSKDLNLNNKIDAQINIWHKQDILKKDANQWYYPNLPEKENEITKILEGDYN